MRYRLFAVLAGMVAGACCFSDVSVAQQRAEHVPGELLVGFKSEQAADEGFKLLKALEKSPGGVKTRSGTSGSVKVKRRDETSFVLKFDFRTPSGVRLRGPAALVPLDHEAETVIVAAGNEGVKIAGFTPAGCSQDRGREGLSPSPPSEPYVRFSCIRLSSRRFLHRDCLAACQAV